MSEELEPTLVEWSTGPMQVTTIAVAGIGLMTWSADEGVWRSEDGRTFSVAWVGEDYDALTVTELERRSAPA